MQAWEGICNKQNRSEKATHRARCRGEKQDGRGYYVRLNSASLSYSYRCMLFAPITDSQELLDQSAYQSSRNLPKAESDVVWRAP